MKFAVLSDIQGNLSALQAVLEALDAEERTLDSILALGDIVGLGPHPNEVVDLLKSHDIESVRGNYDEAVAFERAGSGVDFINQEAEAMDQRAVLWTRQTLTPQNLEFLRGLPRDIRLLRVPGGIRAQHNEQDQRAAQYKRGFFMRALFGGLVRERPDPSKRVLLVHGSTRAINEYIRPDTAKSILASIAREAQADVLVSGHAGTGFQRDEDNVTFVGVGGVSGPFATRGRAEYAVISVGREVESEFGVAEYDPTEYERDLRERGLPEPVGTRSWGPDY
jgi:predicted phosphodiesterase